MPFQLYCHHPNSDPLYVCPGQDNCHVAFNLSVLCPSHPAHHHQEWSYQKNQKAFTGSLLPNKGQTPRPWPQSPSLPTPADWAAHWIYPRPFYLCAVTHILLSVQYACFLSFLSPPLPASPNVMVTSGSRARIFLLSHNAEVKELTVITQHVSTFSPPRTVFIQVLFSHIGKQTEAVAWKDMRHIG